MLEICLRLIDSMNSTCKESPPPQLAYFLDIIFKSIIEPYGHKLIPSMTEAALFLAAYLEKSGKNGVFTRVIVAENEATRTRCLTIPQGASPAWPEAFGIVIATKDKGRSSEMCKL